MNNENNKNTVLEAIAKRIREYLPLRSGMDGKSGRYLVDDDSLLLDERLRCYRYSEKTCSILFDKSTTKAKERDVQRVLAHSLLKRYRSPRRRNWILPRLSTELSQIQLWSHQKLRRRQLPLVEYVAGVKGKAGRYPTLPARGTKKSTRITSTCSTTVAKSWRERVSFSFEQTLCITAEEAALSI